jgi:hypothetical protein
MTAQMPRGAIPVRRSELAASEPYRPEPGAKVFVPSGQFPSSNQELAVAHSYRPAAAAPESFLAWPMKIGAWEDDRQTNSCWAEEAFAKACAEPNIFIPDDVVLLASRRCGSSNFAEFLQTYGFQMERKAYLDGPFDSVDWTNVVALNGAIATVGPVKIGVVSTNLAFGPHGQVTPGRSGWAVYGVPPGQPQSACASLCGYGPLAALVDLFERHQINVNLPSVMPSGLSYAMFFRGSIGIIDRLSLMNITGEAWVRNPTTVVRDLNA